MDTVINDYVANIQRCAPNRLYAIGIPSYIIRPIVSTFVRWVQCNGPEWTISRIKSVKLYLVHMEAGYDAEPPPWFKLNRKGELSGPFGMLLRWMNRISPRRKRKRFNQVINALGMYTLISNLSSPTEKQLEKFESGVYSSRPFGLAFSDYKAYLDMVRRVIPSVSIDRSVDNSLITYRGSPQKRAPKIDLSGSIPQNSDLVSELDYSSVNYEAAWRFNSLYNPVVSGYVGPQYKRKFVPSHNYVGEVHFLQEPGFKLRSIASPYRIHQLALKPIGMSIYSLVRTLPWDCTFDQSKPFPIVQDHLRQSRIVHSVDLSGATDYFPLELQLGTLREIYGDVLDIELIEFISRSPFKSNIGDVQWEHGQPLGLYPSFGMFTLTHGLLLLFLNNGRHDNKFFVVGDDVIILEDDLKSKYTETLNSLGCPWSPEKSVSSSSLCEFAGKIVTPDDIIAQYKWRRMSDDSFLDICRALGPRSRILLTQKQREVFDAVKHLQPPLGLNISRPGSNLFASVKETELALAKRQERVVRSLCDLSEVIHRNMYESSDWSMDVEYIRGIVDAFDEKVAKAYQKTVVARLRSFYHLFDDLPRALSIEPRLPTKDYTPSRVSVLIRLRQFLGL